MCVLAGTVNPVGCNENCPSPETKMGKAQNCNGKRKKMLGKTGTAIFNGYSPTETCPPFQYHSNGKSLVGSEWLRRFAEEIDSEPLRATAWNELSEICDRWQSDICGGSLLTEFLYLFTCRSTVQHQKQEATPLLERELDRLLSAYERLSWSILRLQLRRKLRPCSVYMSEWFQEELLHLQRAKESLNRHREFFAAHRESVKTDPRDWYLYFIASKLMEATGSYQLPKIISLIDAASAAHGEHTHLYTALGLKKRIQRFTKRFEARWLRVHPKPAADSKDADQDIPF